jgi:hypothetical protein
MPTFSKLSNINLKSNFLTSGKRPEKASIVISVYSSGFTISSGQQNL